MRGLIIKMFAALLLGWYLVSIIGFGVHVCNDDGTGFLVAFYDGMSCEEVHPEQACEPMLCCSDACHDREYEYKHEHEHTGSCCACDDAEGLVIKPGHCCSNFYQVLELTGTSVVDDGRGFEEVMFKYCLGYDMLACSFKPEEEWRSVVRCVHKTGPIYEGACDRLARLSVWRI